MSSDKAYRALKERYCALEGEMLVLKNQLTCALLQARENAETANECKLRMEDLEAKLKDKNIHKLVRAVERAHGIGEKE